MIEMSDDERELIVRQLVRALGYVRRGDDPHITGVPSHGYDDKTRAASDLYAARCHIQAVLDAPPFAGRAEKYECPTCRGLRRGLGEDPCLACSDCRGAGFAVALHTYELT